MIAGSLSALFSTALGCTPVAKRGVVTGLMLTAALNAFRRLPSPGRAN